MRTVSFGLTVGLLATSVGLGCSNSTDVSNESESVIIEAVKLDAPSTIAPSTTLTVLVTLSPGGCTSFDRIAVQRVASEIRLTAFGTHYLGSLPCAFPMPFVKTVEIAAPFPASFNVVAVQPAGVDPLIASVAVH
jgi:hypothetical protein